MGRKEREAQTWVGGDRQRVEEERDWWEELIREVDLIMEAEKSGS